MIAVFAIIIGLINIIHGFHGAGWGKGIASVISILLGVVLLARPILATISLSLVLGVLGIFGGVLAVIFAFRLKREAESKAIMPAEVTSVQQGSEVEETSPDKVPPAPVAESALDPDFEFLGLSNLEDLEKFKQSLEYIEGIGPAYAGKVAGIGVQTPLDLLPQGSTPKGRTDISTQSKSAAL